MVDMKLTSELASTVERSRPPSMPGLLPFQFLGVAMEEDFAPAIVEDVIQQGWQWRVKYDGTFWRAKPGRSGLVLETGEMALVVGRQGNVLILEPMQ